MMPTSRLTQTIDCPVDKAFNTVADLTTFPSWNPGTRRATRITEGEPAQGSRFMMSVRGMGDFEMELQDFEQNRKFRIVPHSKRMSGGHLWEFSDVDGKTRIDHELEMRPKGLFRLFTPLMGMMGRSNLKKTAAALQVHLEKERSSPDP